ncbi:MAG TPA: NmrA family NAD(P)-binding protein [Pyrinomonadaceae bacterium]|nr:NmrA family NAD(P)-binding protein [Pyrinomonadaceae bacterium]
MYIVSGATGHTGSAVAKTLLERNLPVRVIVRNREKAAELEKLGAEIFVADLHDADGLTEALKGGKALYLMNPPSYLSEDHFAELEKVIAAFQTAIANSALEKIVVLSSVGGHLESGTGNILTAYKLEKSFENLDIPVTFLRAGGFMENWLPVLETAKTQGILPTFYQPIDKKFPQVAALDIGRVAAEEMLEKTDGKKVVELAGFWLSPSELAEIIGKVLGKEVKAFAVPQEQWLEIVKAHNSPKNAESLVEMFKGFNSGYITFETQENLEGKFTFEQFVREAFENN